MKISYDAEADALYIRLLEGTVTTQHAADGIAIDYTADGRIAGIEILDVRERLGDPNVFKQVVLENIAFERLAAPTS
ncbi:MAG: DUF2283 domain-containing protein [Thermoflexales bacterium]|nr:DUF2283 domain-containing protein [Thermoflexales bacterium]